MLQVRTQLGNLLLRHGTISDDQLQAALRHSREANCRVGEALIALGYCSEVEIGRVLAQQMELPFVDLRETPPTPQVLRLFNRELASTYQVVPVRMESGRLLVAATNPFDIRIDEVVRKTTGLPVTVASAVEAQIRETLRNWTQLLSSALPNPQAGSIRAPLSQGMADAHPLAKLIASAQQPEIVQQVNALLAGAVRKGATDLHFEPAESGIKVRCRIDGQMHGLAGFSAAAAAPLLARLKILSGLEVATALVPRSGVCRFRVDGRSREWKVSAVPGVGGEVIVLKEAPLADGPRNLDALGMQPEALTRLRRLLESGRGGLVLCTGLAGCGRSTTLFALLNHLNADHRHVVTLQASAEMKLPGVQQLLYDDHEGRTAPFLLRVCLEQEPDVIVLDEIRDAETAEIVCRAALAGRLIVSTVAAPGALSAVARLLDMGVLPHVAGAALTAVVGQRLARTVCGDCGAPYQPPADLQRAFQLSFGERAAGAFRKGRGCEGCLGRGVRGRVGVYELLEIEDDFRYLLAERVAPSHLRQHAERRGFQGLEHDAFRKIRAGLIPPEELLHLGLAVAAAMESAVRV